MRPFWAVVGCGSVHLIVTSGDASSHGWPGNVQALRFPAGVPRISAPTDREQHTCVSMSPVLPRWLCSVVAADAVACAVTKAGLVGTQPGLRLHLPAAAAGTSCPLNPASLRWYTVIPGTRIDHRFPVTFLVKMS